MHSTHMHRGHMHRGHMHRAHMHRVHDEHPFFCGAPRAAGSGWPRRGDARTRAGVCVGVCAWPNNNVHLDVADEELVGVADERLREER